MPKKKSLPDINECLSLLEAKVHQNPGDLLSQYELALLYRLLGRPRRMAECLQALVQQEPELSLAHFFLGLAYENLGQARNQKMAENQALQLINRSLKQEYLSEQTKPARLDSFKQEYPHDPNYAEMKYYQKAVEKDQQNYEQAFLLGLAYKRLGWSYAAIEAFRQVIRLKPSYDEAYFELGNTHKNLEKYSEAAKDYQQAIKFKPHVPQPHFQLGLVYLKLNQLPEAEREYQTLTQLDTGLAKTLATEINLARQAKPSRGAKKQTG